MTEPAPVTPDRPEPPTAYRWVVLVVISLAMFANYYVYDSLAPIADILKSELGFSESAGTSSTGSGSPARPSSSPPFVAWPAFSTPYHPT